MNSKNNDTGELRPATGQVNTKNADADASQALASPPPQGTKLICYKGRQVQTQIIGEVGDERAFAPGRCMNDSLLRDEAGRYYFLRETNNGVQVGRNWHFYTGADEDPAHFQPREHVHRISLPAAIIWAAKHVPNGRGWPLYIDASNFLTANRGVDDPPPFPYMSQEEWRASDECKALVAADPMAHVPAGGCLVSVHPGDSGEPFEVTLDSEERTALEERARAEGVSVGEAFLSALRRQLGTEAPATTAKPQRMDHGATALVDRLPVYTQAQLSEVGRAQLASQRSNPTAAALHSLNAAAPKPVGEEEATAARQGQPTPIRDVLLDLAAEWRIKAACAPSAEAEAMNRCADELEAIANGNGKEGK